MISVEPWIKNHFLAHFQADRDRPAVQTFALWLGGHYFVGR
jgi:hypothetical protein